MANGTAVRVAPFTPELPAASAFAKAQADKPSAVSAGSQGIETTIGEAVAAAATTICKAILDHRQTGMLDPEIKDASAARLARVAMLALDHEPGDEDFLRTARESGRRVLRRYFTADHDPAEAEAIDLAIDSVFEIVTRVVADERTLRLAWAN